MAWQELVTAQWRSRRGRQWALAVGFGAGILLFLVLSMFASGARDAIVGPLGDTTTGDLRVTQESHELASGVAWNDSRAAAQQLRAATGGHVSVRLESTLIAVRPDALEAWTGGVVYGIAPDDAAERAGWARYLVWGTVPDRDVVIDPATQVSYAPILIGDTAAARLGLDLDHDGPDFSQALTLTSGRLRMDAADDRPITREAVVVGVFDTGLSPLDRFTSVLPLQTVRVLAGHPATAPVGNALVLHGGDAAAGHAWADEAGLVSSTPQGFGERFLGGALVLLDALAAMALLLLGAALLAWLAQGAAAAARDDAAVVASLRAIGIPRGHVLGAYGLSAAAAVALGAAGASVAALLAVLLPDVVLAAPGVDISLAWRTPAWGWAIPLLAPVVGGLLAWLAAAQDQRRGLLAALRG